MISLGAAAPRMTYADVYFNGVYHGFYIIIERVKHKFAEDRGWNPDGNLYKASTHDGNFWNVGTNGKTTALQGYDKKMNEDGPSTDVAELLNALDKTPKTFTDWQQKILPLFNLWDWFQYNWGHIYASDWDGFDKNYYIYHDLDTPTPFRAISWDMDATWGNTWTGEPKTPTTRLWGTSYSDEGLSSRMFSIPEYLQSYLQHFKCLISPGGALSNDVLIARARNIMSEIKPFILRDIAKYGKSTDIDYELTRITNYIVSRQTQLMGLINAKLIAGYPDKAVDEWGLSKFQCGLLRAETLPELANRIRISEISSNSDNDFIELWNSGSTSVDISGWYLSDSFWNRTKFTIPAKTTLAANARIVFNISSFKNAFHLSAGGETLWLSTNLGQTSDRAEYPAMPAGSSVVLTRLGGNSEFFLAGNRTPGTANDYPAVPPVVITEINYNPRTGNPEYLVVTANVKTNLWNPSDTSDTWKIKGSSFKFPPGVTLEAGASAYVVAIEPAAFRTKYSIPASTAIYGPFDGKLKNKGEKLAVVKPEGKGTIDVDIVNYDQKAPWPVAACLADDQGDNAVYGYSQICKFPFKSGGVTYTSCTSVGKASAWCATEVDKSGEAIPGYWGFCQPGCSSAETSLRRLSTVSVGDNPANWVRSVDYSTATKCSKDADCRSVDSCTWGTCSAGTCKWKLATCSATLTQAQVDQVNACFPSSGCVYIPPPCTSLPPAPANSGPGNCKNPTAGNNVTCTPTCNTGFAGTLSATCNAGTWKTSGSCATTTCASLPPITNSVAGTCNPTTASGVTCKPACANGYTGTLSATCSMTKWTTSGTCSESVCAALPVIANSIAGNCVKNTASQASCVPKCDTGYVGTLSAKCVRGNWTTTGACTDAPCTALPGLANSAAGTCVTGAASGSSCVPGCAEGYDGRVTATCFRGVWNTTGVCASLAGERCYTAPTAPNANAGECYHAKSGVTCTLSCNTGYTGSVYATCSNANWQVFGNCTAAPCSGLPTFENANVAMCTPNATLGYRCSPTCLAGYNGTLSAVCSAGKWTNIGTCSAIVPPTPEPTPPTPPSPPTPAPELRYGKYHVIITSRVHAECGEQIEAVVTGLNAYLVEWSKGHLCTIAYTISSCEAYGSTKRQTAALSNVTIEGDLTGPGAEQLASSIDAYTIEYLMRSASDNKVVVDVMRVDIEDHTEDPVVPSPDVPPSPDAPEVEPEDEGLSGGAIAGIVIGAIVGVVLIGVLIVFVMTRKPGDGDYTRLDSL
eukprot:TRINITY_DN4151_c0_g1_i1.p1 TRINITY_DN4151_c0_g1~~TRINITY_DN4151_c0_g1_i1.p1  ORF type:complete len:1391 (-),score=272.57 TRINITY_DN4151_c0_g1_i1:47-3814(-)